MPPVVLRSHETLLLLGPATCPRVQTRFDLVFDRYLYDQDEYALSRQSVLVAMQQ